MKFETYSDASYINGVMSYAFIVKVINGQYLKRGCGVTFGVHDTTIGELIGILRAIESVNHGVEVNVHSDLSDIIKIMSHQVSYNWKLDFIIKEINQIIGDRRLKVNYMFENKDKRSGWYHQCHKKAREVGRNAKMLW